MYKIGRNVEINDFQFYFINVYCKFITWLFGLNTYGAHYIFSKKIVDIEGKIFFRDERHLFDSQLIIIEFLLLLSRLLQRIIK